MNGKLAETANSFALGVAVVCLVTLALAHAFGLASPTLKTILMIGITISGTVAWVVHARQKCRHCGTPHGYRIRLVNSHLCPKCKGDMRVD